MNGLSSTAGVRAEAVAGISGLQLMTDGGRAQIAAALAEIAAAAGAVRAVVAGVTGFDTPQVPLLCAMVAVARPLPER